MNEAELETKPLRTVDLQSSFVYGPVTSRRLGKSLGINPLPTGIKVCSYDCLYCQYGFEKPVAGKGSVSMDIFPPVSGLLDQLEEKVHGYQGRIDAITFSGNGEPTLHPRFLDLVKGAVRVRDRCLPGSKVALLSNGTTIGSEDTREALRLIDEPIVKLDAGDEELWSAVNRPDKGIDLGEIISMMAQIDHIIIQSLFFKGDGNRVKGNISEESIDSWLSVVERIRPRSVQIYTLERRPATSRIKPARKSVLKRIRSSLEKIGIRGSIY